MVSLFILWMQISLGFAIQLPPYSIAITFNQSINQSINYSYLDNASVASHQIYPNSRRPTKQYSLSEDSIHICPSDMYLLYLDHSDSICTYAPLYTHANQRANPPVSAPFAYVLCSVIALLFARYIGGISDALSTRSRNNNHITKVHLCLFTIVLQLCLQVSNGAIVDWTVSNIVLPTPKSAQMAYFDPRTELLWLIGGWDAVNSGGSFDVYTLNMTSDVWTAHTPLPNRLKTEPYQWTIVQNTFYAFVSNQTLSYDIDTEAFTIENIAPPLPASSGMGACITSYNTQYLIFVGSDTKQLQIYDFNTLQWLSNLPSTTKVRRGGTCVTANDHLFVIGGYDTIGSTYLSTIEKINLLTLSQWDTLSATLSQAKAFTGDIVIGDIIYVIGGYTGTAVSNRVQMISTLDDSITTTTTIDYSLRSVTLATTPRNEIIVLGGRDNQPSDSVIDAIQISVGIATFAPTFAPSNPTNAPSNAPTMPSIPPTMAPTAKLQWCVDTEVIDAWYDGDSIDIANDVWTDKSGYNHHGSIGVSTGIGVFNGTNETHELFTYMNKTAIYGATTTQITFNVSLHPINHTVFNYCKYRDVGVKRRILQTSTQNGVFGFWNGRSGQAVEGNWITDGSTDWFGSEWVISAQQTDLYRGNRIDKTSNPNNPFTVTQQLMIGLGAYGGETSDWACTEIIVIDQKIPLDDIICIENYLLEKYSTNAPTTSPTSAPSDPSNAPTASPSAAPSVSSTAPTANPSATPSDPPSAAPTPMTPSPTHIGLQFIKYQFGFSTCTAAFSPDSGSPDVQEVTLYWDVVMFQCSLTPSSNDQYYECDSTNPTVDRCDATVSPYPSGYGRHIMQISNTDTNDVCVRELKIVITDTETNNVTTNVTIAVANEWIGNEAEAVGQKAVYTNVDPNSEATQSIAGTDTSVTPVCSSIDPTISPTVPTEYPTVMPSLAPTQAPTRTTITPTQYP
eukprot:642102_1